MRKTIEWLIALTLAGTLAGCATTQPPVRIQEAIGTMNAHMPEYVAEANAALESGGHPDAERLTGIGVRLRDGMEALDRWAKGEGVLQEGGKQ
jgi:hypothetical protein